MNLTVINLPDDRSKILHARPHAFEVVLPAVLRRITQRVEYSNKLFLRVAVQLDRVWSNVFTLEE